MGAAHGRLQLWPCWGEQLRKGQDQSPRKAPARGADRRVVSGWGQGRGPALEQVWEPRPPCRKTGCHCAGLQLCFPKARVSAPHTSHCYSRHHAGHTWWTTFNQLPLATSRPELSISQQKGKSRRLGFQNTICPRNGLYTHENKLRESPHCL